jgi:hypothetical protein
LLLVYDDLTKVLKHSVPMIEAYRPSGLEFCLERSL